MNTVYYLWVARRQYISQSLVEILQFAKCWGMIGHVEEMPELANYTFEGVICIQQ